LARTSARPGADSGNATAISERARAHAGVWPLEYTQGRHVWWASFSRSRPPRHGRYVEHLFPDESYRKLVLNFRINDISFAERSVDGRMAREMSDGSAALAVASTDPMALVRANAGGPYGSAVLKGVQADSERVWEGVLNSSEGEPGHSWLKASIAITAHAQKPWTAQAVGGTEPPTMFEFAPPPRAAAS